MLICCLFVSLMSVIRPALDNDWIAQQFSYLSYVYITHSVWNLIAIGLYHTFLGDQIASTTTSFCQYICKIIKWKLKFIPNPKNVKYLFYWEIIVKYCLNNRLFQTPFNITKFIKTSPFHSLSHFTNHPQSEIIPICGYKYICGQELLCDSGGSDMGYSTFLYFNWLPTRLCSRN